MGSGTRRDVDQGTGLATSPATVQSLMTDGEIENLHS